MQQAPLTETSVLLAARNFGNCILDYISASCNALIGKFFDSACAGSATGLILSVATLFNIGFNAFFGSFVEKADYGKAKAYFLKLMMPIESEERDRAECVYLQLIHKLEERSDEDE